MSKNKLFLLLALLLTAATGAWAQTETLLTTITPTAKTTYSETTAGVVTVTPSNVDFFNGDYGWVWTGSGSVTVVAKEGYTITKCVFKQNDKTPFTITTSPFAITFDGDGLCEQDPNGDMNGVTSIEVYGPADVPAATGYTVSLKDGVKDADKWTVKVGEGQAQALPIGGLKGDGSETVTLQYNGRLKVKGVKATSEAAAPSVPDGAISGKFSVSGSKQVYFSKGNLRYASSKWSFFDNQYDYYTSYSADERDHFGWSTSATTYGMNTSTNSSDYSGDFVDWGATMGTGWRTLTSDEWEYLFNTRTVNNGTGGGKSYTLGKSVGGVLGVVLYPDDYTGAEYSGSDWASFESAGCVFLPAAGRRKSSTVTNAASYGYYWSSSPDEEDADYAHSVYLDSDNLYPALNDRYRGFSVRLVQEATSDAAAAKPAATVTTAPTGAAIACVGKTTALVSGGVADGGTLWYAVTTTNTMPTSTDGFSDAVPTAKDITASGKVYVWYYVKGDDTHSDSEIAATAIEVPVADIVWDATNVSDLSVSGNSEPYEKEGVTLSCNANQISAAWHNYGDPTKDGISFNTKETGGFTFTAPTGKAFAKIEMKANGPGGWSNANLGTGWAFNNTTVTWTGSASTVDLLTGANKFNKGTYISYIAFYLSE